MAKAKAGARASRARAKPAPAPKAATAHAKRAASPGAETPSRKRAQLARRDTERQVDRAMEGRLDHVPKSVWATKLNTKGQTGRRSWPKASAGKPGSKFWSNLFEDFGLNSTVADTLPVLVDTDVPSSEMLDVLSAAHHDNPVRA